VVEAGLLRSQATEEGEVVVVVGERASLSSIWPDIKTSEMAWYQQRCIKNSSPSLKFRQR
jgi:hypothetical protein